MTAYVGASVLLRIVLGEPGRLRAWSRIDRAISSEVIRVECLRTLDRARHRGLLDARGLAERRADVVTALERFDLVTIDRTVLDRAAEPFPTPLGSLDGLHLASALLARAVVPDLCLVTHDAELATAARAVGFEVLGVGARA